MPTGLRSARGEHNGPYSDRRLSGGDGLIIPVRVDVPQDRYPVVNWLIIAGAIAVFVWQTLSIQERREQMPGHDEKVRERIGRGHGKRIRSEG